MIPMSRAVIKWVCGFLLLAISASLYAQNTINSVRVWPSPDSTRVVFDLTDKPDFSYFMLKNPLRLVVDLENTEQIKDLPAIPNKHQIVSKLRYSKAKNSKGVRFVFELTGPVKPVIFALAPTGPYKNRLVVDLYDKNQAEPAAASSNAAVKKRELNQQRDIVIAIDAGHGGEVHADAFTSPQPNGASVWVLSLRRANSEIGKWIEDKEKHSELLGGAAGVIKDTASEKYLAQALLDMSMDHSMKTGFSVAEGMVQELKKVAKLHKKEPQAASLAVLKSPDIPSILVETGFISNPREERLLKNANHQERLAKAIFTSIKSYYLKNPPDDSLFASLKEQYPTKHKVRPGESLSLLASRYGVSVNQLKQVNQLKSNTLFIGQELDIPQS